MNPKTNKEFFLAKAAGEYSGDLPEPITREEHYLKEIAESGCSCDAYTKAETDALLGNKLPTYTADSTAWDTTPTANSTNPVTSGGIKAAFDADQAEIDWAVNNGVKNLLQLNVRQSTASGITFTVDKEAGTITATGTAGSSDEEIHFLLPSDLSGNYYVSGCPSGGSSSKYDIFVWDLATSARVKDWSGSNPSQSDFGDGTQIQIVSGHDTVVRVRVIKNTTVSNLVFKPMIRPAAITDPTFEPYAKSNAELTAEMATVTNTGDVYIGSQLIRKVLTQAEYDLLDPPDPKVDYLIVPAST